MTPTRDLTKSYQFLTSLSYELVLWKVDQWYTYGVTFDQSTVGLLWHIEQRKISTSLVLWEKMVAKSNTCGIVFHRTWQAQFVPYDVRLAGVFSKVFYVEKTYGLSEFFQGSLYTEMSLLVTLILRSLLMILFSIRYVTWHVICDIWPQLEVNS